MPRAAFTTRIAPLLKSFQQAFPDILLELDVEARLVDIVAQGFDAGIRYGSSLERDMVALLSGSVGFNNGEVYYALLYAARGIPFGVMVGSLPLFLTGTAVLAVLLTAALIQLFDGFMALQRRRFSQSIGPFLAMVVHLLCALALVTN